MIFGPALQGIINTAKELNTSYISEQGSTELLIMAYFS